MPRSEADYKGIAVKNILWIVLPYLVVTMLFGALLNGFLIAVYALLLPLSVIGSLVVTYSITRTWPVTVASAILIGLLNYALLWLLLELHFPFKFMP
ncbi:MAG: hypothetical protein OXR66_08200 [Candidatus Woesearchaeota archaeon]|nr:hypothetical protein [Candidatus Woesearchaeota archaeon]